MAVRAGAGAAAASVGAGKILATIQATGNSRESVALSSTFRISVFCPVEIAII